MALLFSNNSSGTLANTLQIVDTSLVLNSGEGALFPSPTGGDTFYATVEDTSGNLEIISCTARSGDTLTVTRAQESTTAQLFAAGSRVEIRVTAATLAALIQTVDASAVFAPLTHFNPNGTTAQLLDDGNLAVQSTTQGGEAVRTTGQTDTVVSLADDSEVQEGFISTDSSKRLRVRNSQVSGISYYEGTDASGTPVAIITLDPDAGPILRFEDEDKVEVVGYGIDVKARNSLAPYDGAMTITTADGATQLAKIGFVDSVNEFRVLSIVNGFTIGLLGANSGGTTVRVVDGSPDGPQNGYFAGAKKYSTAADGLGVTGVVSATTAPTADSHLTRKDYVDTAIAALAPSSSLANNGYYTHPGGYTDQWGRASVGGNTFATVTFSTPYASTFSVVATIDATDTGQTNNLTQVSSIGTSSFRIYNGGNATATFYWQAKGVV